MLHPYTKCDLERPTDRPLGFTFLQATEAERRVTTIRRRSTRRRAGNDRTLVSAVFKPETGGKIIQVRS